MFQRQKNPYEFIAIVLSIATLALAVIGAVAAITLAGCWTPVVSFLQHNTSGWQLLVALATSPIKDSSGIMNSITAAALCIVACMIAYWYAAIDWNFRHWV